MPVVSICIPAYKQVELLKKNIESVFFQTYTDYEIVITDDSPDNSIELLMKEFQEKFPNKIHYFKNQETLGSPENWNESVRRAQGKYIKIVHHDDWFSSPESLHEFVKMLEENPAADLAFCSTAIIEADTNLRRSNSPTPIQLEELKKDPTVLFFGNFIGPPSSVIYRKDCGVYFDKKTKYVVDIDFYIRVLNKNRDFVFNSKELIVNSAKLPDQVTYQSLNAITQVGEYAYLFNKIKTSVVPQKKYLSFFKSLFLKYSIKEIAWFHKNKLTPPRPVFIFALLIRYLKFKKLYKN